MDMSNLNNMNNLLGMDVMKELQKLVDAATVGGHKEKTTVKEPEHPEQDTPEHHLAKDLRKFYNAFKDEGFDSEESFELLMELIRTFRAIMADV